MAKRQVSNPRPSQFCGLPSCAVHGGLRHPVELEIQLNYLLFFVVLPKLFRTTWRCSETRIAFYHSPLPKRTCHEISAKFRLLVSLAAATSMPKSPACWSLVCVEIPGMMVKNSGTQCKSSEVQPPGLAFWNLQCKLSHRMPQRQTQQAVIRFQTAWLVPTRIHVTIFGLSLAISN